MAVRTPWRFLLGQPSLVQAVLQTHLDLHRTDGVGGVKAVVQLLQLLLREERHGGATQEIRGGAQDGTQHALNGALLISALGCMCSQQRAVALARKLVGHVARPASGVDPQAVNDTTGAELAAHNIAVEV